VVRCLLFFFSCPRNSFWRSFTGFPRRGHLYRPFHEFPSLLLSSPPFPVSCEILLPFFFLAGAGNMASVFLSDLSPTFRFLCEMRNFYSRGPVEFLSLRLSSFSRWTDFFFRYQNLVLPLLLPFSTTWRLERMVLCPCQQVLFDSSSCIFFSPRNVWWPRYSGFRLHPT